MNVITETAVNMMVFAVHITRYTAADRDKACARSNTWEPAPGYENPVQVRQAYTG